MKITVEIVCVSLICIFNIISFLVIRFDKKDHYVIRILLYLFLFICSILPSEKETSLYFILLTQLIIVILLIMSANHVQNNLKRNISILFICFYTVAFTTLSFGTYYYMNNMIIINYNPSLINVPIFDDYIEFVYYAVLLIKDTAYYYFTYTENFVNQLQFYIGIVMSCTVISSLFAKIKKYTDLK